MWIVVTSSNDFDEEIIKKRINNEDSYIVVNSMKAAVEAVSKNDTIFVLPGKYYERLEIKTSDINIIGEDPDNTIIYYDLGAFGLLENGEKRGTFRSYSVFIDASNVYVEGVTIANTAGAGKIVGQALALYAEGDNLHFKNCRFLGHQDTIFTGPLPPMEYEHNGFVGPKERAPRINGRQWYEKCYIEGDVDFIFGSATAFFSDCTICSLNRNHDPNGYVTAPSTPKGQTYGYVFKNCEFTTDSCKEDSVYLSRPWRDYAKVVFIDCSFGKHIKKEGFHDWNKPCAHETVFYAEYPKISGRVDWEKDIDNPEFWRNIGFMDFTLE